MIIFAKVNFKFDKDSHEKQEILSVGGRRPIVGGGSIELHGPPNAFYYAGSNENGHC